MIHEITANGRPILISINPLSFPRSNQSVYRQVSQEVQAHEVKYSLVSEGVLYLEENKSLHIASLLQSEILRDPEKVDGEFTFTIPFDHSVYIATVDMSSDIPQVVNEELLTYEGAAAALKNVSNTVVFECGALSSSFRSLGHELVGHFDLNQRSKEFSFKRAKDTSFYMLAIAASVAAVFVVYNLVALVSSSALFSSEDTPVVVDTTPSITNNLGSATEYLANSMNLYVPLLSYDMYQLGLQDGQGGTSITATGRIENIKQQHFDRLQTITDELGGQLHITNEGWYINAIPGPASIVGRPEVKVDTLEQTLRNLLSLNSRIYEIELGERTSNQAITVYSDYMPTVTIDNPSPSILTGFSHSLVSQNIKAEYLSHTISISEGVYSQIVIKFLVRGA